MHNYLVIPIIVVLFFLQTATLFSATDITGIVTAKRDNLLKVEFRSYETAVLKTGDKVEFSLQLDGMPVRAGTGKVTQVDIDAVWVEIRDEQPDLQMDAVIHSTGEAKSDNAKKELAAIKRQQIEEEKVIAKVKSFRKYKVVNVARNDTLNVRSDPYVGRNNKIGELGPYVKNIKVLRCKFNYQGIKWCKIEYKTTDYIQRGWVAARYIARSNTSHMSSKRYRVVSVKSDDTLSVRNGPGIQYYKIGDMAYNARNIKITKCQISTRGGKWCQVKHDRTTGWVSATHLRHY